MIKPLFYRKKLYFSDKTFISETKTFKKKPLFLKIGVDSLKSLKVFAHDHASRSHYLSQRLFSNWNFGTLYLSTLYISSVRFAPKLVKVVSQNRRWSAIFGTPPKYTYGLVWHTISYAKLYPLY